VEADPIGLEGEVNLFVYVQNAPLNLVDPYGLKDSDCKKKKCVGKARIREGNRRFQRKNKRGAFGIGVRDGLAVIPSQWGWSGKSETRPYLNEISGTLSDGTPLFDKITDIQDNSAFGTTAQAQRRIIKESGGHLVLEIYGQSDLDVQDVIIYVPSGVSCPFGTKEAK